MVGSRHVPSQLSFKVLINLFQINRLNYFNYRVRQIPFFLENVLKKLLNIFSDFLFYLEVQSFRLIKENNFIQMAVLAGHAVAYTIGPIFNFTNGFTNIVI